jgi:erythromycin esterase-like protein
MKDKYQLISLCLFLLLYTQYSLGQTNSFTNKYDLGFDLRNKKIISWKPELSNFLEVRQDSSQTINEKNPLYLSQVMFNKFAFRLKGSILQTILLPMIKSDSITVSLNCKSKNLSTAWMIITGIDAKENVLITDTLFVNGSNDWNKFSRKVSIKGVEFLNLAIQVEGIKTNSDQRLYLDKIEIKINGKGLDEFPLPVVPVIPDLKKSDIISLSLSDNNSFNKIAELKIKKIVAIGETIHGSESITETAFNMIKHQVEFNNCKLILLELPLDLTLRWNRFVQGDIKFKIEDLSQDMRLYLFSPRAMIDFLTWLKQYNEKEKDKVSILGMDINISSIGLSLNLFDFIYRIDENKHSNLLNSLCSNLLSDKTFPQAYLYLEKNNEIADLLGKNEYEILLYCLKESIDAGNATIQRFSNRDIQMYSNTIFLLNQFCPNNENAVIYAHIGHTNLLANDLSLPFNKSFGYFMKNKFGDQYYSIAVLTGGGTIINNVNDSLAVKKKLKFPLENSLENLFERTNEQLVFTPVSTIPNSLTFIHEIGNQIQDNQFSLITPGNRVDALLFIRNSKAFDLLPSTPTCSKDIQMLLFKEIEDRHKRYLVLQNSFKNNN